MSESTHFIGIGGIGVSALAQLAQGRGVRVSGSDSSADPASNAALARLIENGAVYSRGHRADNIAEDVTLVIATAAVGNDNPEIAAARARDIRIVSRAEYLGELMSAHAGPKIAVAGTHGKTTTTAMIGVMLQQAGLDPTVFVGAEVAQLGGNVRIGSSTGPFVAEACEAYDSFLHLHPDIAVITNVEADHLDHYGTEEGVFAAFERFLLGIAKNGSIVACGDDSGVARLMERLSGRLAKRPVIYSIERDDADVMAYGEPTGPTPLFIFGEPGKEILTRVRLQVPGLHNIKNALAAATTGILLGVDYPLISAGLAEFHGAERRQEVLGEIEVEGGSALVMDDYAHHPTEIRATMAALRGAYAKRRLIVAFQPHLYSRTRDFLSDFAESLSHADLLVVTDVYAARELPITGVDAEAIIRLARELKPGLDAHYIPDRHEIPAWLSGQLLPGDLVVSMGAGDIREQGEELVNREAKVKVAL